MKDDAAHRGCLSSIHISLHTHKLTNCVCAYIYGRNEKGLGGPQSSTSSTQTLRFIENTRACADEDRMKRMKSTSVSLRRAALMPAAGVRWKPERTTALASRLLRRAKWSF
jgi:hypothetical protein